MFVKSNHRGLWLAKVIVGPGLKVKKLVMWYFVGEDSACSPESASIW